MPYSRLVKLESFLGFYVKRILDDPTVLFTAALSENSSHSGVLEPICRQLNITSSIVCDLNHNHRELYIVHRLFDQLTFKFHCTQPEQLDEGSSTSVLSLVLRSTPRRMTTTDPSPRRQVAI
ncbi:hypothetical protein PGT21_013734 [Puccinia graminis f. sp. tritici]|uniref:Uncharacterized protein n=1 Tax=Puccinia graminis f. sp. tritici TaxID=56615 RepID=A0A5B0QF83_PUCGR|nr:hypothetical protein PGT21_013734 [Puccinia graminis f. sp. tritici]